MINSFFRAGLSRRRRLEPKQGYVPGAQQFALAHSALITSNTTTGHLYSWKGMQLAPIQPCKLFGLLARYGGLVSGATHQGMIATVDGSNNINWFVKSAPLVLPASAYSFGLLAFYFAEPVILIPGKTYQLLTGRTDSTDNYNLLLQYLSTLALVPNPFHLPSAGMARIVKANPAIGQAVSIDAAATYTYCVSPIAEFPIL